MLNLLQLYFGWYNNLWSCSNSLKKGGHAWWFDYIGQSVSNLSLKFANGSVKIHDKKGYSKKNKKNKNLRGKFLHVILYQIFIII